MDYIDYLLAKAAVLIGLAAVYGFVLGINGKSLGQGQNDKKAAPKQD